MYDNNVHEREEEGMKKMEKNDSKPEQQIIVFLYHDKEQTFV